MLQVCALVKGTITRKLTQHVLIVGQTGAVGGHGGVRRITKHHIQGRYLCHDSALESELTASHRYYKMIFFSALST